MFTRISFFAPLLLAGCMAGGAPSATTEEADTNLGCEFFVTFADGTETCLQDGYTGSAIAGPDDPTVVGDSANASSGGLKINYARYGSNCVNSAFTNAVYSVRAQCQGQPSCSYTLDATSLGDPAYGCAKDFRVGWTCPSGTGYSIHLPPEALGSTAILGCPNG